MTERFPEDWKPEDEGYVDGKPMADGRWWCLLPLMGGRFRIVIAEDRFTSGEHWCYSNPVQAVVSFMDGPEKAPEGWTRHMLPDGTFERRDEQGNPYVSDVDPPPRRANPREDPEASYAAFMSMGQDEFQGLCLSLLGGGVLQPAEQIGFERAIKDRAARNEH